MRYLIENNNYKILYGEGFGYSYKPHMVAFLEDKNTGKINISKEQVINGNIEKCLMKLGKRLIQRWKRNKKEL